MDFPTQTPNATPNPATPPAAPVGQPAGPMPGPAMGGVAAPQAAPQVAAQSGSPMAQPAGVPQMGGVMPPTQQQMGAAPMGSGDVHTMPDKFLDPGTPEGNQPPKKKSRAIAIVLVLVIVLAVAGIIGGVAYYMLSGLPANEGDAGEVVAEEAPADDAPAEETPVEEEEVDEDPTEEAETETTPTLPSSDDEETDEDSETEADQPEDNDETDNEEGDEDAETEDTSDDEAEETTTITPTVPPAVASEDSDKDGLTDVEEILFGTLSEKPDTDSDSYSDGDEVLLGYDPAQASKRLEENSSLMNVYSNAQYGFKIMHPTEWSVRDVPETANVFELSVVPGTSGDLITVSVQNNPGGLTAADFYSTNANVDESSLLELESWTGSEGVLSEDGYTAYYTDDNFVYIVSYTYGTKAEVDYGLTFGMMANSIELTGSESSDQGATDTTDTTDTSGDSADDTTGSGTEAVLPGDDNGSTNE